MTNDSAPSYIHTGGAAGLGPHSDKTLDMAPGSVFVSVNVGATRAMLLRRRAPCRSMIWTPLWSGRSCHT